MEPASHSFQFHEISPRLMETPDFTGLECSNLASEVLTGEGPAAYISAHTARCPLYGAMARLRSTSLIFGERPPISIGGRRLRRLSGMPGAGPPRFRAV